MWKEFLPISMPISVGTCRVSVTWRAPCLWCPLPASVAGRAGARPDHPITGELDPSAGAAILRALRASELQSGAAQGGDGEGGDGPADADRWGDMGGPDRSGAGGWSGGKSRSGMTLRKVPMDGLGKPRNRW
jgi:hypothetical protein